MRILLTAGPTHEPIDSVRYIGNRSSGRMGSALAASAVAGGHQVTLILGPVAIPFTDKAKRIDIQSAAQMQQAVLQEIPKHDLLIMAAAVADYRPITIHQGKLSRQGSLTIECEPTEDIVAAACRIKTPSQRVVGFSLESGTDISRASRKLAQKGLDLIVCNPTETMDSPDISPVLIWPDGRTEQVGYRTKAQFADILLQRALALFA